MLPYTTFDYNSWNLQEKCNHPNITIRDITLFLHFVDFGGESGVKPKSN